MKRTPFKMSTSRSATLRCDGKFIVSGRASFVWETFLMRRAAGVPGRHEIRAELGEPRSGLRSRPWHKLEWTMEEAEQGLADWFGPRSGKYVARARRIRAGRGRQGLMVA